MSRPSSSAPSAPEQRDMYAEMVRTSTKLWHPHVDARGVWLVTLGETVPSRENMIACYMSIAINDNQFVNGEWTRRPLRYATRAEAERSVDAAIGRRRVEVAA